MKNNAPTTVPTPKELLHEVYALVAEAERMIGNSISEQTSGSITALRERCAAIQQRLRELLEGARKEVVAGVKYTDRSIRGHPYQSLAVAVGAGVVAGLLLRRRDKH
jgi:ElaB/YqjD/DUF883 family membrane-anchored ribosome-binding protein